jgi:hypothetical protein
VSLPDGVRAIFAEEVPDMPWVCTHSEHGSHAHKHTGVGTRWFYKPSSEDNGWDWEDWSNDLALLLPEDAETWPGVNPGGAQESIIEAALSYLVSEWESHRG